METDGDSKATRRVTRSMQNADPTSTQSNVKSASSATSLPNSAFIPTQLERILIAVYPSTLLLGSLFSILNPTNRAAPYSSESQSHPPSHAPSYFARKSNVFNRYFVKIGWFWTTLALLCFVMSHSSLAANNRKQKTNGIAITNPSNEAGLLSLLATKRRIQAFTRYLVITIVWAAMTQWCFGPALIDRAYRFTGGQCELLINGATIADSLEAGNAKKAATHAACKAIGGAWKGGHDISGHVFILILGSAMLWLEILPAVFVASGLREERRIVLADGTMQSAAVETEDTAKGNNMHVPARLGVGVKAALGVAGLSWWMLLMTAAYFHTWFEKFTGLVVAFATIYAVYFVPRGAPGLRAVLGMPGV